MKLEKKVFGFRVGSREKCLLFLVLRLREQNLRFVFHINTLMRKVRRLLMSDAVVVKQVLDKMAKEKSKWLYENGFVPLKNITDWETLKKELPDSGYKDIEEAVLFGVVAGRKKQKKEDKKKITQLRANNSNPCMKCGSVQCAICSEDLKCSGGE